MKFQDQIYGEQEIKEEVLVELINSRPVQRLKKIHQAGPSPFFMEEKPPITRFEHSLGVLFLLRKFDASIEEQIAGLLHDVPHTAFSHVADFVFEDEGHEYHEKFLEKIIYNSEIPDILESHGFDVEDFLDESNFGLLERDLPKLCADRLDYSMRDLKAHFNYDINPFIESLTVKDGEFVFKDEKEAEKFAELFMELDANVYASPEEVAIYEVFADIIREALEKEKITEEDLFGTDRELMQKLRKIDSEEIKRKFDVLDQGLEVEIDEENYDLIGNTKPRAVDPPVKTGECLKAISEISPEIGEDIEKHLERIDRGLRIKIVNQSVDL